MKIYNVNTIHFGCKESKILKKSGSSCMSRKSKFAAVGAAGAVLATPFVFMKKNPTVIRCKNGIMKVLDKFFNFWSHIA